MRTAASVRITVEMRRSSENASRSSSWTKRATGSHGRNTIPKASMYRRQANTPNRMLDANRPCRSMLPNQVPISRSMVEPTTADQQCSNANPSGGHKLGPSVSLASRILTSCSSQRLTASAAPGTDAGRRWPRPPSYFGCPQRRAGRVLRRSHRKKMAGPLEPASFT
jgi:hypothetical protein